MARHPETVLEEKLRRARALAKAAVAETDALRLGDCWAIAELLDLLETTLEEADVALGLAVMEAWGVAKDRAGAAIEGRAEA